MATLLPIWAATGTVTPPDASKISVGWLLGEKPPHEYMNWWQQEMVLRINHVLTQGIPEWDATTPYPLNAAVKRLGLVYRATTANQNSQPPSANWLQVSQNASALTNGVVPNAVVVGAYTNFTAITASGVITAGSSIITGGVIAHSSGNLSLRTGTSATNRLTVTDAGITVAGTTTSTTFAGSASGLTNIPAEQLTGTINNARLNGDYSFANLDLSGSLTVRRGNFSVADPFSIKLTSGYPSIWFNDTTPSGDSTDMYISGANSGIRFGAITDPVAIITTQWLRLSSASAAFDVQINANQGISGNGSLLTALNASNLASGTVPNARLVGAYSFTSLDLTGALTAATVTSSPGTGTASGFNFGDPAGVRIQTSSSVNDIRSVIDGTSRLIVSAAAVTVGGGAVFTGNGSGLTALNASQLTTGTLPNARLVGDYSFGNLTLTGSVGMTIQNAYPIINFIDTSPAAGEPVGYRLSGGNGNLYVYEIDAAGAVIGNAIFDLTPVRLYAPVNIQTGGTFVGNGSTLTALNASQLTAGTVPNARISGAYTGFTNITASGTITAAIFNGTGGSTFQGNANDTEALPSFTWTGDLDTGIWRPSAGAIGFVSNGSMRLRVGADILAQNGAVFGGPGTDLTDLNATQLLRGTVPVARLGTGTGERDWVGARTAAIPLGGIGSVATMYVGSGGGGQAPGTTYPASALYYASSGGGESSGRSTTQPSTGTWRAEGAVGWRGGNSDGGEERRMTTLKRIS